MTYQETLGDLHNLFGDTHVAHIRLDDAHGWWIEEIIKGDTASLLPFATGMAGLFYLGSALVLDGVFLVYAVAIWLAYTDSLAKRTFRYSILYLALLVAALMVDHYLALVRW